MSVLNYQANNTLIKVHNDSNKYLFVRGSVGSGKSVGCMWQLFLNALKQPVWPDGVRRSRYAILRASYPTLKSTVVKSMVQWFNQKTGKKLLNVVYDVPIRASMNFPHPDGKSMVEIEWYFIALDREEEVNKLQSLELTSAWMNEAAEIPRGIHQMLKSRINRFPAKSEGGCVHPHIVCDYNSVDTEHWLYKLAEVEKPANHSFYVQPPAMVMCRKSDGIVSDLQDNWYKVNPDADNREHLDEDYYIDQISGADADWVSIFVMNNYGNLRGGKVVYRDYDDRTHAADTKDWPLKGLPVVIGIDLGLDPAAAFCQMSPTGQLIVFDEIATEDCSIQEFIEDYLRPKMYNQYRGCQFELFIDPAGTARSPNDKKSAMDIFRQQRIPVRTAATNEPLARRESVSYFLRRRDKFFISKKHCPTLRKGFISEYKYELMTTTVQGDKYKDKPEKNFWSHVHDGLQYAALACHGNSIFKKSAKRTQTHNGPADASAGY